MAAARKRYRNPNWSLHVHTTFNDAGIELLNSSYGRAKQSGLDRAEKLSADDLACSVEALLRSLGVTAFFR
jgi:hypothetical protein